LRGVAREAGVAAPSVYLHFSSKEELLRAVVSAHFSALQQAIESGVASAHDPTSRLLAGCLAYCRYAAEHPGSYQLLFNTPRPEIKEPGFAGTSGASAPRPISGRRCTGQPHCAARPQGFPGRRWKTRCAAYWRR
jgi:AcrR family transcriptional regulator